MDNKSVISVLNDLIETSLDGEKGFQECAEDLKTPEYKSNLIRHAEECRQAAQELQQTVISLGGDPQRSPSVSGALHRGWIDFKSAISGKDDEAILNECERGEDVAISSYKDALAQELPSDVRSLVERQYQCVQRSHDQVKAMRDSARAY
ncbi:ferritin-like domain-containing protein [Azomonas macrocytogenes]|uniref:Uncharacterized protein (TIGR02284 family) n=1 Tax=Azomonas macrocytogenes TaxID=69962 RepID=A0A839T2U0_AZOMA|nr:PA2169 family four-helix-bundle protein [Azomonas macrocytogenes]MBB3102285.1 uncharacterized protein (TIGR02284 family) [Azomonas macrocytogenes]